MMKLSYPELELVLEETRDKFLIGMHFQPVQGRVGHHNCCNSLIYRIIISRHVNAEQTICISNRVVCVHTSQCTSISNKVFSTGCDFGPRRKVHPFDWLEGHLANRIRVYLLQYMEQRHIGFLLL